MIQRIPFLALPCTVLVCVMPSHGSSDLDPVSKEEALCILEQLQDKMTEDNPASIAALSLDKESRYGVRPLNAREKARVKKIINANLDLLTGFKQPMTLSFLAEHGAGNPQFDPSDPTGMPIGEFGRISVPDWILQSRSRIGVLAQALLSHELGHQVFVENIGLRAKGRFGTAWREAWRSRLQAVLKYYRDIEELKKKVPEAFRTAEEAFRKKSPDAQLLSDEHRRLQQLYREEEKWFQSQTGTYNELAKLSMPYQELFSDLLAVLYSNDPKIMANTMEFYTKSSADVQNLNRLQKYRDFTNELSPQSMLAVPKDLMDPHHDLAPVRGFIGRRYLARANTLTEKQALLHAIFQAIAEELDSRFRAGPPPRLNRLSLDQVNQRLIDRIGRIRP